MKSPRLLATVATAFFCLTGWAQDRVPPPGTPPFTATDAEIRSFIEQLVFQHEKATDKRVPNPDDSATKVRNRNTDAARRKQDPFSTPLPMDQEETESEKEYRRAYEVCSGAFYKLTQLREKGFSYLIDHLSDQRPSIPFDPRRSTHTVSDACYWNLFLQLEDRPVNYLIPIYTRVGRDGQHYTHPYWMGCLFDEVGGIRPWLAQNAALSYPEKQLKCLNWLLAKEKEIGVSSSDNYFRYILPLEIRILERQQDTGVDTTQERARLYEILKKRDLHDVPTELLPPGYPR